MNKLDEIFKGIDNEKRKWIGLVKAKVKSKVIAEDIFQSCNLKILEAVNDGRLNIQSIHSGYYYKCIMSLAIDHLQDPFTKADYFDIEKLEMIEEDVEPFDFNKVTSMDIEGMGILISNKLKSIPLSIIADQRGVSYSSIQRKNAQVLTEVRQRLNA